MTRAPFDAAARSAALDAIGTEPLDLLVIGGGITGCGTARDAAMRGLRTALVERGDFASGTSSRSSRLIHGGLRYLEHAEIHLVFEASRERRTLLREAPGLVRPLRFTWPVYRGARVPRWKLWAALMLYDGLALFRNIERHRMRTVAELLTLEPALRCDGLVGGATYYDATADDARLTLANARAAADAGARVANHAAVRALIVEQGVVRGAEIECALSGRLIRARARCVVNATGPWSDQTRRLADPTASAGLRGTKGAHIAVPRARVGNTEAIAITHPRDGRVMFILPAREFTIIGTTDTYDGSPLDAVRATSADVAYLLEAADHYVPAATLSPRDVVAAWAGIRPLVASTAKSTAALSREHAITISTPGMITVTGGKLTTYRVMSEQIVDRAQRMLGVSGPPSRTDREPLAGEGPPSAVADGGADRLTPALPYRWADVRRAVTEEMALTVADVLVRRMPLAFETTDHGASIAAPVARFMAPLLDWTTERERDAVSTYARDVERIFRVD